MVTVAGFLTEWRSIASQVVASGFQVRSALHVRFGVNQCCDPFAQESVVIDSKNTNWIMIEAHVSSSHGIVGIP